MLKGSYKVGALGEPFHVRLHKDIYPGLREYCEDKDVSMSELLRDLVEANLRSRITKHKRGKARNELRAFKNVGSKSRFWST